MVNLNNKMVGKCRICKENKLQKRSINLSVTRLYICNNCSVAFAHPNYVNKRGDYYEADDIDWWKGYYKPFRTNEYRRYAEKHREIFVKADGFLDVGCGVGWFLDVVKNKFPKIKTVGLEPSKLAKKYVNKKHKLYTLSADKLANVKGKFDIISFWQVMEHLDDPHKILKLARRILKKSGALVISVPNRDGIIYRLSYLVERLTFGLFTYPLKELFWVDNPHGHLFDYNFKSLKTLLDSEGFKIIDRETSQAIDLSNVQTRFIKKREIKEKIFRWLAIFFVVQLTNIGKLIGLQDVITVTARKR